MLSAATLPLSAGRWLARMSPAAALLVVGVVIAGWMTGSAILRSFVPGRVDMKLVTCATALAGAAAVMGLARDRERSPASSLLAGVVLLLSAMGGVEYATGAEFSLLTLLSPDDAGAPETMHAGRMAPNTMLAFLALGSAWMLLARGGRPRFQGLMTGLIVTAGLIPVFAFAGFIYGVPRLRGVERFSPMALPTAATLALLTLGTIGAAGARGYMPVLFAAGPGGALLRRLLPVAIAGPLLLGWLRLVGQDLGLYGTEFGTAAFAVSTMTAGSMFVILVAVALERQDARERALDVAMRTLATVQHEIVTRRLPPTELMNLIAVRSCEITRSAAAVVEMMEGEEMVYRAAAGTAAPHVGLRLPVSGSLSGLVCRTGKAARSDDCETDGRVDRDACRRVGARSMLIVPLRREGATAGTLKVYSPTPAAFTGDDERVLSMLGDLLAAVLSQSQEFATRDAAIAEQAAEIGALRQRFRSFVDRSPAFAFIKDRDGFYLYANEALQEAAGAGEDGLLGMKDEAWLSPDAAEAFRARDREVLASRGESRTLEQVTIGGRERWWTVFRFAVESDVADVLGGIAIDVTEQKLAEENARRLNAGLEQRVEERTAELRHANEEMEAFSYSVSHDLRTPLRAIDGFSRMLEEDYGAVLDDEGKRLLQVVRANTARMSDLIRDLLEFSRVSRRSLTPVATDVAHLARSVAKRLLAGAGEARSIDLRIDDAPPAVVDPSMFEQVLTNLLANALKYTRGRDPALIEFRGWREDGWLVYSLADNGAGFDMRYAGKLFGVFQRLHHNDEFEGTGVGLAIVKRVVDRHGGRIWAEAEVGKGARFCVALPAAEGTNG